MTDGQWRLRAGQGRRTDRQSRRHGGPCQQCSQAAGRPHVTSAGVATGWGMRSADFVCWLSGSREARCAAFPCRRLPPPPQRTRCPSSAHIRLHVVAVHSSTSGCCWRSGRERTSERNEASRERKPKPFFFLFFLFFFVLSLQACHCHTGASSYCVPPLSATHGWTQQ